MPPEDVQVRSENEIMNPLSVLRSMEAKCLAVSLPRHPPLSRFLITQHGLPALSCPPSADAERGASACVPNIWGNMTGTERSCSGTAVLCKNSARHTGCPLRLDAKVHL